MAGKYPALGGVRFGWVTVNGQQLSRDLWVFADGTWRERDRGLAENITGSNHLVPPAEVELLLAGSPEVLVVGTGMYGSLTLTAEAGGLLEERKVRAECLPSPEAVARFGELTCPRALLLHVTC